MTAAQRRTEIFPTAVTCREGVEGPAAMSAAPALACTCISVADVCKVQVDTEKKNIPCSSPDAQRGQRPVKQDRAFLPKPNPTTRIAASIRAPSVVQVLDKSL